MMPKRQKSKRKHPETSSISIEIVHHLRISMHIWYKMTNLNIWHKKWAQNAHTIILWQAVKRQKLFYIFYSSSFIHSLSCILVCITKHLYCWCPKIFCDVHDKNNQHSWKFCLISSLNTDKCHQALANAYAHSLFYQERFSV